MEYEALTAAGTFTEFEALTTVGTTTKRKAPTTAWYHRDGSGCLV